MLYSDTYWIAIGTEDLIALDNRAEVLVRADRNDVDANLFAQLDDHVLKTQVSKIGAVIYQRHAYL